MVRVATQASGPGIEITGLHHHSVRVTDLERSRAFYRDVLGLRPVATPPTFRFAVAWFAVGEGQIHLLAGREADPPSPRHIALHVRDLGAARERLRACGCRVAETTPIPGAERFFTWDPDGNQIELICWQRPWDEVARELGLPDPRG